MSSKIKESVGWLGDVFSIIGVPVVLLAWWCISQSINLSRTQSESAAKDTYVQKVEFQSAINVIKDSQEEAGKNLSKLWERQAQFGESTSAKFNDIQLTLQHINDTANTIKNQTK